jgi:transcriptional regulator with XRE-family HTH domain
MSLTETFARSLRVRREQAGLTQEALADRSGLDRTYVSQLERGLKSPTLNTIESVANTLGVAAATLLRESPAVSPRIGKDYIVRGVKSLAIRRESELIQVDAAPVLHAIDAMHDLLDDLYASELDVARLLGMRNLSAFVGELLSAAILANGKMPFVKNPHQDGYPDLLLLDRFGKKTWEGLRDRFNEKRPFSPFAGGGIEIKATCGSVPTPAKCRGKGMARPDIGNQRISCITSLEWKAHHRDTNNLLGVFWDFIDGRPRVAALFYSAELTVNDWGRIVSPREGGGRTTSVSIISDSGRLKMLGGWLCVLRHGGYVEFLNRRNRGELIPASGR